MPNIEITQAQADALARGENITLKPPPKALRTIVITFTCTGNVFEVKTRDEIAEGYHESLQVPYESYVKLRSGITGEFPLVRRRQNGLVSGKGYVADVTAPRGRRY